MVRMTEGTDPRTGRKIEPSYANWTTHPNNPMALKAAE
jgi:dihydropyrimidine dehydrogenase (NAD+) subunit PreA